MGRRGCTSSLAAAYVGGAGLDVGEVAGADGAEAVGGDAGLLDCKTVSPILQTDAKGFLGFKAAMAYQTRWNLRLTRQHTLSFTSTHRSDRDAKSRSHNSEQRGNPHGLERTWESREGALKPWLSSSVAAKLPRWAEVVRNSCTW